MLDLLSKIRYDLSALDNRAVFAFVYAAIGLTCIAYLKDPFYLNALVANTPLANFGYEAIHQNANNLNALIWWALVSVLFYVVVPAIWVRFVQKRRLSEIGLAIKAEPDFIKLLVVCIVIMLPIVYLMSLTDGFSTKYPFLKIYDGSPYLSGNLLVWEIAYFAQFFGLEFFFRGFMVHSLKSSLGIYSIFAMMVPYTMIHFQKPMPEAFAAIIAGIFLGWISYRNGTIWLGLVLHCVVAISMDILALYHKGLLF